MGRVSRIGTIDTGNGRRASVYIQAEIKDSKLSISGCIGPLPSGNTLGGCGQIDMGFAHRNQADNDKRYSNLIQPSQINFAPNWNAVLWLDLLDIWKKWHLNDMHAECEHQRGLGWRYEDHHDPKTFEGEACPVCGYKIGSAWQRVTLPQSVIDFITSLPETDKQPAWV